MYNSVKEIKLGCTDDIFVMVKSVTLGLDKYGNQYQKLSVRDREGNEDVFLKFGDKIDADLPAVIHCRVDGGGPATKVVAWEAASGENPAQYLPKPRVSAKSCWSKCVKLTNELRPSLREIVSHVMAGNKTKWATFPLNESGPYSRLGGIAEASLNLETMAYSSADIFQMDGDMLTAATLLYYIGYANSLDVNYVKTNRSKMTSPSVEAYMMVELANTQVRPLIAFKGGKCDLEELKLYDQDVYVLENILLSSDGKTPAMTREAVYLKRMSDLNLNMDSLEESMNGIAPGVIVELNSWPDGMYKPFNQNTPIEGSADDESKTILGN